MQGAVHPMQARNAAHVPEPGALCPLSSCTDDVSNAFLLLSEYVSSVAAVAVCSDLVLPEALLARQPVLHTEVVDGLDDTSSLQLDLVLCALAAPAGIQAYC